MNLRAQSVYELICENDTEPEILHVEVLTSN